MSKPIRWTTPFLGLLLALGCWAGAAPNTDLAPGEAKAGNDPDAPKATTAAYALPTSELEPILQRLPDVAEKAVKSVVNISSTKVARGNPYLEDPFFRFFGQRPRSAPERREKSLGSGVIVREDGVVLTNNHVVANAEEIAVTLSDGRELEAELVGTDPESDLAVIRLKEPPQDLTALPLGRSAGLRLGETVLAIGNPFGVGQTVTMGIVSATGRANVGIVDYEDFIQTDAAINPGNSGGALVNMRAELVGINTAILSRSGGYQGIGFAIPSDMVKTLMLDLLDDGQVSRGFLGVFIQDLTPELAASFDAEGIKGVLLSQIMEDGPAEKAGLEQGDIVTAIDGEAVDSASRLRLLIASKGADKKTDLTVLRGGKKKRITVALGEKESEAVAQNTSKPTSELGVRLAPVDDRARQAFRLDDRVRSGAVVVEVAPGSDAAESGLRPGDVITEVNRKAVRGPRDAMQLLSSVRGNILLRVVRGGGAIYVVIDR